MDVDLGLRKKPGSSGKPRKSGFPGGNFLRVNRPANSTNGVEIHGWVPFDRGRRFMTRERLNPIGIESLSFYYVIPYVIVWRELPTWQAAIA